MEMAHFEELLDIGNVNWRNLYNLCLFDWTKQLESSAQDQIYLELPMKRVFQHQSIEYCDVIRRLNGVVEHRMPRPSAREQSYMSQSYTFDRGIL